ncbi:MAG: TolB family protein [Actinomycetota bacterium]
MTRAKSMTALVFLAVIALLLPVESSAQGRPQNGRIAYISGSLEGPTDVASITASGTVTKLTRSEPNELYVDVSSDGRLVAFTRFGKNGGDIYTVPIRGGNVARLTSDRVHDELPIWSPDSDRIAFVRYPNGADSEIFIMDADGSNRSRITDNNVSDADPRWSPDGTQLIYNSGEIDTNGQDVLLVSLGEPGAVNLTTEGVNDSFAEWSPDGNSIAYSSFRNEQWDVFVVATDGTGTARLTDDPVDDYAPEWSPDGSKLLYVHGRLEGNLPADRVIVMNPDGSEKLSLSPPRLNAFSPDWSPDGAKIVFIGQVNPEAPNWEIFKIGSGGTDLKRLTRTDAMEFDPEWARR